MEVSEFYIVPEFRHLGVGFLAAQSLFHCFGGKWQISVFHKNIAADSFWSQTIGRILEIDHVKSTLRDDKRVYEFATSGTGL
ncbi:MAG: hypothetical protein AB3N20_00660 [Rhizobiaceae bacterium]